MTHKERFLNSLANKPVDFFPHGDGLWPETTKKYIEQGKLKEGEDPVLHFDMSWRGVRPEPRGQHGTLRQVFRHHLLHFPWSGLFPRLACRSLIMASVIAAMALILMFVVHKQFMSLGSPRDYKALE